MQCLYCETLENCESPAELRFTRANRELLRELLVTWGNGELPRIGRIFAEDRLAHFPDDAIFLGRTRFA